MSLPTGTSIASRAFKNYFWSLAVTGHS
jgi:hypothetical protein